MYGIVLEQAQLLLLETRNAMSAEIPIALATVSFEEAITGLQIAALAQEIIKTDLPNKGNFIVKLGYHNGDVMCFGRVSRQLHHHIRIIPSLEDLPFLYPQRLYSRVAVTSHFWVGTTTEAKSGKRYEIVGSVAEFAADLAGIYKAARGDGFPKYVAPVPNNSRGW